MLILFGTARDAHYEQPLLHFFQQKKRKRKNKIAHFHVTTSVLYLIHWAGGDWKRNFREIFLLWHCICIVYSGYFHRSMLAYQQFHFFFWRSKHRNSIKITEVTAITNETNSRTLTTLKKMLKSSSATHWTTKSHKESDFNNSILWIFV